jgi:hypothetical protein
LGSSIFARLQYVKIMSLIVNIIMNIKTLYNEELSLFLEILRPAI